MREDQPFTVNDWTVEPELNRLVRGTDSQPLRPQVMKLLAYLAQRPGTVARSDELMRELWPGRIVTDATLYNCVAELRRTLGEGQGGRRFVQTVHKKGYRLCADVAPVPDHGREREKTTSGNPEACKAVQLGDQRMDRRNLDGWKQAEKYYRRAIELDPDNSAAWQKLAECIVSQFGTFEKSALQILEARNAAERAIELDDDNGLAWISYGRAEEALAVVQYRRVSQQSLRELYQRAIELVPDHADTTREYGLLLLRTNGQLLNAIELLESSVKLDPLSAVSHFALGSAYRLAGRSADALACLQRSVELQPDNPYPIWETGLTHYAMGELADAMAWGVKALEFERDDPSGPFLLAQVALNLGDVELATEWTERGLSDGPEAPIAAATQMSLALAQEDLSRARAFAEELIPHAGEMRIVHPGAVAQALWILRDRDIDNGLGQRAIERYALYVPELFEADVRSAELWLVAAVDVAYLFYEFGDTGRSRELLNVVKTEAAARQYTGAREIDTAWLEIEATALLGDVASAERMLAERSNPSWICWWDVLRTRPTVDQVRDSDALTAAARMIEEHRVRQRHRYAEKRKVDSL